MGIYIDLAIIVIFLIFGIVGLCRGLFKSIMSLLGFFGSLALAILLKDYAITLVNKLFNLQSLLEGFIGVKIGEVSPILTTPMESADQMITAINATELNSILKGLFSGLATRVDFTTPISVADIVVSPISSICVMVLSVVALFLIIRLLVLLLNLTIGKIVKKAKGLKGLNRFLGFLFGLVQGGAFIFSLMAIVSALSLIPSVDNFITTNMDSTIITKYGYNVVNDIIVDKLSDIVGNQEQNEEVNAQAENHLVIVVK